MALISSLKRFPLFCYSIFGMPLSLVALPVYVYAPSFYAEHLGLSLATIGLALLCTRIIDAFIDPAIGLWIDRSRQHNRYAKFILLSLPLVATGFFALFHPPAQFEAHALAWLLFALTLVYPGYSLASITYQSWGAGLTQKLSERSLVTASREGCGLIGVVLAAILPKWIGLGGLSTVFIIMLAVSAWLLLTQATRPPDQSTASPALLTIGSLIDPFRNTAFRWLFSVFILNGIASAIPATLFLFFAKDRLHLENYAGLFLGVYFIAGAASMPLWVALARRLGEARTWLISMLLAVAAFGWAFGLMAGSATAFGIICVMSGFTLGADLALPPALLTAVIGKAGHSGQREGAYFGAWNWATKMNLALAAGAALPLLAYLGYLPGTASTSGLSALAFTYALLPCGFKLIAAFMLFRSPLKNI